MNEYHNINAPLICKHVSTLLTVFFDLMRTTECPFDI